MSPTNLELSGIALHDQGNTHMRRAIESFSPDRINQIGASLAEGDLSTLDQRDVALIAIVFNVAIGNFLYARAGLET